VAFNVFIINDVAIFMLQLSSAELSANWAQWWWWRFNGAARIAASVGGAVIFCIVVLGPKLLIFLGFHWADKLIPAWWWQAFTVMGLTTALWITVALVTKPDPDALLRRFYQRAQPLGWWGPFQSGSSTGNQFRPIGKGIFIAFLGAAATSLFILALSLFWLARYTAAVATIAGAIISFFIFRKLTNQYLAFLSNRTSETVSVPDSQLITEKS
jgi:predicted membrane protein